MNCLALFYFWCKQIDVQAVSCNTFEGDYIF